MKKKLSLFLAIIMVLGIASTAIPTSFAASSGTDCFQIGDDTYHTLKSALDAANDGAIIEMLDDYVDETTTSLGHYSKNVTINGNGHLYTKLNHTNKYIFTLDGGANFTINNMRFHLASGFYVSDGTLNLNDCTVNTTYRMALRTSNDVYTSGEETIHTTLYRATFNIHNTTLAFDEVRVGEPVVLLDAGIFNVLNVTGTSKLIRNNYLETLTVNGDGSTNTTNAAAQNRAIINIGHHADNVEINFAPGTEMVLNQKTEIDGNTAYAIYKCNSTGWDGTSNTKINLSPKSIMRITTNAPKTTIFGNDSEGGMSIAPVREINQKGVYYLMSNSSTTSLGDYTSTQNECYTVYSFVTTGESIESGYTTYKMVDDTTKQKNFKYLAASNGTTAWADDLITAINNAVEGSVVKQYANVTYDATGKNSNPVHQISKSITVDGNGYSYNITNSYNNNGSVNHQNFYGIKISANKTVEFKNFSELGFTGGGFMPDSGSNLYIRNVDNGHASGRPFFRIDNYEAGAYTTVHVTDSKISQVASADTAETLVIFNANNGYARLILNDGAELSKKNSANNAYASCVMYENSNATIGYWEVIMNRGSKIIVDHASPKGNFGGAFCLGANENFSLTVNEGAYIVCDTENLTALDFIHIMSANNTTVNFNVAEGAFLVKDSLRYKMNAFSVDGGNNTYSYDTVTSKVTGYNAYSLGLLNFAIGNKKYTSLRKAIKAASSGDTITLMRDYSGNENTLDVEKDITFDLNGFTYTTCNYTLNEYRVTSTQWYLFNTITSNFTIQNGNMQTSGGAIVNENGHLTLKDVTWTSVANDNPNNAWGRPIVKLSGNKSDDDYELAEVTLDNTTIIQSIPYESTILIEHTARGTVNVTNHSTIKSTSVSGYHMTNNAIIAVQQETTSGMTHKATDATINVDGTSKIVLDRPNIEKTYASPIITDDTTGTIVINLASGSKLSLNRPEDNTNSPTAYIYTKRAEGSTTINDGGCTLEANVGAFKGGVILPTLTKSGATFIGYNINNLIYKGGYVNEPVRISDIKDNVSITPVFYTDDDFGLIAGASLRTKSGEGGLRFSTYVSDELLAALGNEARTENLEMGIYVAPAGAGVPSKVPEPISQQSTERFNTEFAGYEDKNVYHIALILEGMKYENAPDELVPVDILYNFEITAQSYFTVNYADGTSATFYTNVTEDNTRSMADVAEKLLERHNETTGEYAGYKMDYLLYDVVIEILEGAGRLDDVLNGAPDSWLK